MPRQRIVEPKLRLRDVVVPLASVRPLLRWLAVWSLLAAVVVAGVRFFTTPGSAEALEFTPHTIAAATTAVGVLGLTAADLDNDGDQDLVSAGLDDLKVYQNNGSGTFTVKIVEGVDAERVYVADLNKDGSLDLVAALKNRSPSVRWYRNTGTLEYSGTDIGTGTDAKVGVGDLDKDGAKDIVTATNQGGVIVLQRWMNNGSGTFTATTLSADSKVTTVAIGTVDGGSYPNIVTGGGGGLQRWSTSNGTTWSRSDIDDSNGNKTTLAIADVDSDGKTDIVTGDQAENTVAFYKNQDNGSWKRNALSGNADPLTIVVADLDGDGDQDIIVASQDDNSVLWYDNDGSENFTKRTLVSKLQSVFSVAVADFDGDGDLDFAAGDHFQGAVYWYERLQVAPKATAPTNIQQSTDGSGRISFETTISDGDNDPSRIRVQYSFDGVHWDKPWLTKVKASTGSVDLKNSNGFQIGTGNPIDTNKDAVKVTLTWDTKSTENTGGPVIGDRATIQLRVLPRDNKSQGKVAVSKAFRVDNAGPTAVTSLTLQAVSNSSAQLSWTQPTDSSVMTYQIYYDIDLSAVLNKQSAVWDGNDDPTMNDTETTSALISGLDTNKTYTFKLFVRDAFGNESSAASMRTKIAAVASPTPTAPVGSIEPTTSASLPTGQAGPSPLASVPPTQASPTPTAKTPPSVLQGNQAPLADAGVDQVVNPEALVILDGSGSFDADNERLIFNWRQISGPPVSLLSERTSTPSFSAGAADQVYIFSLTVHDSKGASATDTVTVATRPLPAASTAPVQVSSVTPPSVAEAPSPFIQAIRLLNLVLFSLALLSTLLVVTERLVITITHRRPTLALEPLVGASATPLGRVVHYRTGLPIANAIVLVYDQDGKLRSNQRTTTQGTFSTLFTPGAYTIAVQAPGFTFASTAALSVRPEDGILYTGGTFHVRDESTPLNILIPLKPTTAEVSPLRVRFLHSWQVIQRVMRLVSWPLFLGGAILNTVLVFISPSLLYLGIEVLYVVLVITKIGLEIRVRPAYGLVRDAITHVPLDLAVVRLMTAADSRLIMTRVTNAQGKFFALPPPGKYTVTITKPGYAPFSKHDVDIKQAQDAALQITADLLPVIPQMGLQKARQALV